ncbi:MAG: hypothetical protein E7626_02890 [Ruminococcaceae bacterium]|nr:hypothetical protein [Oscillospiraceae bacterium]
MKKLFCTVISAILLASLALTGCEFREDSDSGSPTGPVEYFKKELKDPSSVSYNVLDYIKEPNFSELKIYKSEIDKYVAYDLARIALDGAKFDTFKEEGSAQVALFDTANITYKGRPKDESLEISEETMAGMDNSSATTGYDLIIGSGGFIGEYFGGKGNPNKGFEEQLIGMAVGETKDITVTFPDKYQSTELQGVEVIFTVKINSLQRAQVESFVPTDDQCKKGTNGEYETTEEYKAHLENYYKGFFAYEVIYPAIELSGECKELFDVFFDLYVHEYVIATKGEEITQSEYDAAYAETVNTAKEAASNAAREEMKSYMISDYLFEKFNITLTEEELKTRANEIWEANKDYYTYYGIVSTEAFIEYFSKETLEISFKNDKLIEVIGDSVTVVE